MKKLLVILYILPLLSFNIIQEPFDIVGRWSGEDKGDIGFINFDKEGYASFETQGQIIGGKEFLLDGKKGSMRYKINTFTDPVEIDFTITKIKTKEEKKLLAIVKTIDKDNIIIAMTFGGIRPISFDDGNSMTLTRVR